MGSFAPARLGDPDLLDRVTREIIEPTLSGMAAEGHPFAGCLYCGLMLTDQGPKVVEFNGRFGDPETQVQLPLVGEDLGRVLLAAAGGRLADAPDLAGSEAAAAVCVVLAAAGYPEAPRKGAVIHGLEPLRDRPDVKVFQAGTDLSPEGDLLAAGGRVLSVVGLGRTLIRARDAAYSAIDLGVGGGGVAFDGMQLRRDIAASVLTQEA
jgi:phosphoribosylamine--glycine ligase